MGRNGQSSFLKVKVLTAQLCPTLCDPMDCSPPSSSVFGILQPRILEWVAMPSSRGYCWPRDRTRVSHVEGRFFTVWASQGSPIVLSVKIAPKWVSLLVNKFLLPGKILVKIRNIVQPPVSKCHRQIGEGVNGEIRAWSFQLKVHTSDSASVTAPK